MCQHIEETAGPWVWMVAVGPGGSQHPGCAEWSQDHSSRNSESVRISLKTQGEEHREDEIRTENYGHVCGKPKKLIRGHQLSGQATPSVT